MQTNQTFQWKFHRIGGLDQVTLRTAEELRHLRELDPKLWVALSCPSSGLEFNARTLQLIDTDKDGRIRIPEVLAAVEWICSVLKDPAVIVDSDPLMPLACINTDTQEGKRLLATARTILKNLGKADAEGLSGEDAAEAVAGASRQTFNGDGILPPLPEFDDEVRLFIEDALAVMGGVEDAGGQPGINREIGEAFLQSLRDWKAWRESLAKASKGLGVDSAETWDLLRELQDKIEDYFLRCDLASFSPQAVDALNADEHLITPAEHGLLDKDVLADLPLALIAPDRSLSLTSGLNPAWRMKVERLFAFLGSRLAQADRMTRDEWRSLREAFAPYDAILAAKPALAPVKTDIAPASSLEALGKERIDALLASAAWSRFDELAARDLEVPAASGDIAAVERLVLYYRHLYRLLMNFVSFYDFYSLREDAAFQAGTLYMDGRSCRLCLPVADVARHSTLAAFSEVCLVYCDCRRRIRKDGGEEEEIMHIAAAMTAGDSDLLLEGRNGVFVDNTGSDWDATLVKMVSNPISMRQALWQPYKRLGRMISEQIGKIAGSKQAQIGEAMGRQVDSAATAAVSGTPPAPSPQGFDIGKSVGIFAAIGLAIGAIGTALASIANALFSLAWWQFPLVFLGLFLLISGPSFVLAWLKLRKRTLGPLLEASGWAVNGKVPINFALGKALTSMASLPSNASRSYKDPFGKPARWPWAVLAAALLAGAAVAWLWFNPPYWNKLFDKTPLVQHSKAQKTPDTREQGQSPLPVNATRANATRQTNK